jgi:hypothetical protein
VVQYFRDQGQRISILHCDYIKSAIIDTETEAFSRVFNEKDGGGGVGTACSNKAFGEVFIKITAEFLNLITAYAVNNENGG